MKKGVILFVICMSFISLIILNGNISYAGCVNCELLENGHANCTMPKSSACQTCCCGRKISSLPHKWSSTAKYVSIDSTVSGMHAKKCICGARYQYSAAHTYSKATCTKPKICTVCSYTTGSALGHNYASATCTLPSTCTRCNITKGTALGHTYSTVTCTAAPTCVTCGITEGEPLGHNYSVVTCTEASKCIRCNALNEAALGHSYVYKNNATTHWKECTRCGDKISIGEHTLNTLNKCETCGYVGENTGGNVNAGLVVEEYMRENIKLGKLAVSLRNSSNVEKENKNVYMLNESIIYYIDYKNGTNRKMDEVKIEFKLPLAATIEDADGGTYTNNTITWNFNDGLASGEAGTKTVILKYTNFNRDTITYKSIYPVVDIYEDVSVVDSSATVNVIFKSEDTEIMEVHMPYMKGDANASTFRPNDTITRAEAAIVLTRIFGMDTSRVIVQQRFPDMNETYEEAQKAITAATACGLINGYTDGTYKPNQPMTIAEFMKILATNLQLEAIESGQRGILLKNSENAIKMYKDPNKQYIVNGNVVEEHWASAHVSLLIRLNMTPASGVKKDLQIDSYITRAEVTQLINYYLLRAPAKVTSVTASGFSDVLRTTSLYSNIIEATRLAHTYTLTLEGTEIAK